MLLNKEAFMSVKFRHYKNDALYGDDYNRVRNFLIELDRFYYSFSRWDWMPRKHLLNPMGI